MQAEKKELLGALIGLARATDGTLMTESSDRTVLAGLKLCHEKTETSPEELAVMTARAREEKYKIVPHCRSCAVPCGRTCDADVDGWTQEPGPVRAWKERILAALCGIAAAETGADVRLAPACYEALFALGEAWDEDFYPPVYENVLDLQKPENVVY